MRIFVVALIALLAGCSRYEPAVSNNGVVLWVVDTYTGEIVRSCVGKACD